VKLLLGKDVFSDELLYVIGLIGFFGMCLSYEMMKDVDMLLIVGSSFLYI